jgi:hypothetical protein
VKFGSGLTKRAIAHIAIFCFFLLAWLTIPTLLDKGLELTTLLRMIAGAGLGVTLASAIRFAR